MTDSPENLKNQASGVPSPIRRYELESRDWTAQIDSSSLPGGSPSSRLASRSPLPRRARTPDTFGDRRARIVRRRSVLVVGLGGLAVGIAWFLLRGDSTTTDEGRAHARTATDRAPEPVVEATGSLQGRPTAPPAEAPPLPAAEDDAP